MLEIPAQGPGSVHGVVGGVQDQRFGGIGQLYLETLILQAAVQITQQQVDNAADVFPGQRLVEHDLVQPVEEFGPEGALQKLVHLGAGLGVDFPVRADAVQQVLAAQVGGEDDDGILEVHRPALAVGNASVVQHLQKHVEHVWVGLFHLVEQDDTIGAAAHRLGELAALFVAHVPRRGADEPGNRKLFHILAHVDAHQIFLTVKQGLGQRLGQFGLANPGGAQEQEGADGFFRVGDACPGAENSLAH